MGMRPRKNRLPRPSFVYENLGMMKELRLQRHQTLEEVSQTTLIPVVYLDDWENKLRYPSQVNYNKLAGIFVWEIWE